MLDNETYQQELIRMFDCIRKDHKGEDGCEGVECKDCPLNVTENGCRSLFSAVEVYNAVEKWSREHPKPKYKVSQLEYDILRIAISYSEKTIFDDFYMLTELLEEGYFKGATLETNVGDYFDNCEVVDK